MSLPRASTNPYAASVLSPSSSTSRFDRRPSNYASSNYGFPPTSSSSTTAYPNPYGGGGPYSGSGAYAGRRGGSGINVGRTIKRLLKITQMDFEVASWELLNLLVRPGKVWRGVWYRRQTRQNTTTPTDPALTYLLLTIQLLTSLPWSLTYAFPLASSILGIAFVFCFVHFLGACMLAATLAWVLVPRAFGRGGWLVGVGERVGVGRVLRAGRRRGLFDVDGGVQGVEGGGGAGSGGVEWGFAFEVAIRAFVPIWFYLYVVQFLLLPLVASESWPSTLLSNIIHLAALSQTTYITFLGYNSIPSLASTHLMLIPPLLAYLALFLIWTVSGWNASLSLAPVLWCWGGLRGTVGGEEVWTRVDELEV